MERRDFLKLGTTAVAAGALAARDVLALEAQPAGAAPFAAPPIPLVRIGYVGVGGQGSSHVRNLLKIKGCQVTAVCDIRSERTDWASKAITEAGFAAPAVYDKGPRDFERLC
jgi:hypothetical protein